MMVRYHGDENGLVWCCRLLQPVEGDGLEQRSALAWLMSRGDQRAGGLNIGFSGGAVMVGAGAAPAGGADVWLACYVPRTVEVAIPRGENAGYTLPYKNVVREMVLLGHWRGEAASFPLAGASEPGPRRGGHRARPGCGPILAAAKR